MTLNLAVDLYGSASLGNCVSMTSLYPRGASKTINMGSCFLTNLMLVYASASITMLSDLVISGSGSTSAKLYIQGSFSANGFNVTAPSVYQESATSIANMGSGTWTLTGYDSGNNYCWNIAHGSAVVTPGASTIKITDASSAQKIFGGLAGKTFNNLWYSSSSGVGKLTFVAAHTFATVTLDPGTSIELPLSVTTTVANLVANGTGAPISIKSATNSTAATLAKSGGGTIYVDYCSVRDITASPASTFFARNSTNVSGNTNWTFIPSNSSLLAFF